jgi:predicted O-methyltransferase YrrM
LLQPRYWPELRRFAMRRLSGKPLDQNTSPQARAVTADMAITHAQAFRALGLPASAVKSFAEEEHARSAAAQVRVSAARDGMGGGADIDLLYSLCLAFNAARVLETGVAFGWSSLAILSAIARRPGAILTSVDLPYLGANLDDLVGLAVPNDLRAGWSLRRGADRDELPQAIADIRPIDLAHYDSDKSYAGRRWAYPLIWDGLRDGGLLMSDDVEDNLAFLDFAADISVEPLIVGGPHRNRLVGILRKA